MQELLAQLYHYAWGVWRHRWLVVISAWLLAIAGWVWVYQLPQSYVGTARVYVDSNSILRPLLSGLTIQPNVQQRIAMMSRTLLSRPNLEQLMRMTDMDLAVQNDAQRDATIEQLRSRISLVGDRANPSLYSISYEHENREMARRIVQALITVFIETSATDKRMDTAGAQTFLDRQIADYEKRLVEAEERLAAFKQRNVDTLPGETGTYYQRLSQARGELRSAELQMRETQNRKNELERQLAGEEPVFLGMDSGGVGNTALDGRIRALEAEMDNLMLRYTERHPQVVQIRNLIEVLQQQRDADFEQARQSGTGMYSANALNVSPVYQGMRSMLAQTEAQLAELSVRVKEYGDRVVELEAMVNRIPQVETELKQLDRDYTVIQQQYGTLVQRRESAMMSEQVDLNANDVVFRVIDPPFVPQRPSKPDKLLLSGAVFVLALGVATGLGLLVALLRPVVSDARFLGMSTGLPVLGSVSLVRSPAQQRAVLISHVVFGLAVVGLLATAGGISAAQMLGWV